MDKILVGEAPKWHACMEISAWTLLTDVCEKITHETYVILLYFYLYLTWEILCFIDWV